MIRTQPGAIPLSGTSSAGVSVREKAIGKDVPASYRLCNLAIGVEPLRYVERRKYHASYVQIALRRPETGLRVGDEYGVGASTGWREHARQTVYMLEDRLRSVPITVALGKQRIRVPRRVIHCNVDDRQAPNARHFCRRRGRGLWTIVRTAEAGASS